MYLTHSRSGLLTTPKRVTSLFLFIDLLYLGSSMPFEDRVAQVLDWFTGDPSTFPNLVLMYFEQPDSMGHADGPYGDRV